MRTTEGDDGRRIVVRQVKSGIGFPEPQKRTLRALGLSKIGRENELPDNPQTRGMIAKVTHLVEVLEVES